MKKLEGKVALITGGNSGMGLATAKLFHAEGAKVIITARSEETFKKAKAEYGTIFDVVQTDVSKLSDLDRLYAHIKQTYQGLDVVFANAGIGAFTPSTEVDEEFFDRQFNTNVRGLFFTVTKAIPLLRPGSSVILNASTAANQGMAGASVYSATKAAVRSLARTWTVEIPNSLARFNVLSPGPIETPIFDKVGLTPDQVEGFLADIKTKVPAGRIGRPEEIATVALFLATNDSSFVSGIDLVVSGGLGQV
jgi:NAD(P)-dependent dehydrogenase (short-subunit alcohol dehydrogenase family)